jgi:hypothetical protein
MAPPQAGGMMQPGAEEQGMPAVPDPQEQPASAEEQAQYERFVGMGLGIIAPESADGQPSPEIAANLSGDFDEQALSLFEPAEPPLTDSPQDSVAATAVILSILVENSIGEEIGDDVVMHGGKQFVEALAETSEAMGLYDFTEEDLEGVWYRAIDLYRVASPRADPNTLGKGFEMVMAADKAGRLNDLLSGQMSADVAPGLPGGPPLPQQAQQAPQQQGAA